MDLFFFIFFFISLGVNSSLIKPLPNTDSIDSSILSELVNIFLILIPASIFSCLVLKLKRSGSNIVKVPSLDKGKSK
jgi:hypothetical protein